MAFGEKIKSLRKSKGMNQTQLANALGVSPRTIRGWEAEGRYPKQHELYQKLADTLECDISYLMTEGEAFITEAAEQYGSRGAKQAQQILDNATNDANDIRIGAMQYTDDLLANAESIIGHTLDSYTTKYDGLINSLQECYDTVRSNRAELDIPEDDDYSSSEDENF